MLLANEGLYLMESLNPVIINKKDEGHQKKRNVRLKTNGQGNISSKPRPRKAAALPPRKTHLSTFQQDTRKLSGIKQKMWAKLGRCRAPWLLVLRTHCLGGMQIRERQGEKQGQVAMMYLMSAQDQALFASVWMLVSRDLAKLCWGILPPAMNPFTVPHTVCWSCHTHCQHCSLRWQKYLKNVPSLMEQQLPLRSFGRWVHVYDCLSVVGRILFKEDKATSPGVCWGDMQACVNMCNSVWPIMLSSH